jgi:hypothetical protein
MSRKGVSKFTPHCLDEPCFDKGWGPIPKPKEKKEIILNAEKKEKHQARMRRYRNGYRGSISEGFQRYVIIDKTPIVSTPVIQPK